jgi:hypothetical protein
MIRSRLLVLVLSLLVVSIAFAQTKQPVHPPLFFEANEGQTASQVRYLAHGGAMTLFLTDGGPVLAMGPTGNGAPATVKLDWLGGNAHMQARGEAQQPGVANYLIGRDPSQWHTNVPTFGRVRYAGVYPGVDVVFHGMQHALEYDVVVMPGADPRPVAFRMEGAKLSLDPNGDLLLHTANGELRQHKPMLYQTIGGKRRLIAGGYRLQGDRVSFNVGNYDHNRELVIDPTLTYSTYLGGNLQEWGWSLAVDGNNQAYVLSQVYSTNFPIKNAYKSTSSKPAMAITKFTATGGALVYSTYFGTSCTPAGIAVDRNQAVYFDATCDPAKTPGKIIGSPDMTVAQGVVAKLNPSGASLAYSLIFGGNNGAFPTAIALDSTFHAYVTGGTSSVNFPTTAGAYKTAAPDPNGDAFVVKVNASGTGFTYATYFANVASEAIAVNSSGEAYIAGDVDDNLPTTAGAFQQTKPAFTPCDPGDKTCRNFADAFATKFNASGSALVYSTYLGGNNEDDAYGMTIDANGNAYIVGQTFSNNYPTTAGAFQRTRHSGFNFSAFVTKLNSSGSALSYSTYLSGSGGSTAYSVAVNSAGHAFVTGQAGAGFPVKTPVSSFAGSQDVFVAKLWATGGGLHWSTYMGGSGIDLGKAVRLDGAGNAYVTGQTDSVNFHVTSGAYRHTNQGFQDIILFKITN